MGRFFVFIASNAVAGKEAEYNEWYSTIHIDEVLRVPGFSSCQRFQVSDVQREGSALPPQKYLNVFELVTDDPIKAMADLRDAMSSMHLSDAVDYTSVASVIYEAA